LIAKPRLKRRGKIKYGNGEDEADKKSIFEHLGTMPRVFIVPSVPSVPFVPSMTSMSVVVVMCVSLVMLLLH
jgi:hypothetical protein